MSGGGLVYFMLWTILAITASYLIGSIPTAYLFGRRLKGIDIRQFGSGNVGATNALRLLGKGPGITVLALDMLKGILAVVFLGDLLLLKTPLADEIIRIILGLSCICGHIWTVFLNFKGGKGVATTVGVLAGLAFKVRGLNWVLALVILTWLIVFMFTRVVSLSSIISVLAMPLYMLMFIKSAIFVLSGLVLAVIIVIKHLSNMKRFFQGKESHLDLRKPT